MARMPLQNLGTETVSKPPSGTETLVWQILRRVTQTACSIIGVYRRRHNDMVNHSTLV